jgi:thiazole/oxazole-forming peptide maturase SagD family component
MSAGLLLLTARWIRYRADSGQERLTISRGQRAVDLPLEMLPFLRELVDLADGDRDARTIVDALDDYDADDVTQMISLLRQRRLLAPTLNGALWLAEGAQSRCLLSPQAERRLGCWSIVQNEKSLVALDGLSARGGGDLRAAIGVFSRAALLAMSVHELRAAGIDAEPAAFAVVDGERVFVAGRAAGGACARCIAERFPSGEREWALRTRSRDVSTLDSRPLTLPPAAGALIEQALTYALAQVAAARATTFELRLSTGALHAARAVPHFACPLCCPDGEIVPRAESSPSLAATRHDLSRLVDRALGLYYAVQRDASLTLVIPGVNDAWVGNNTPLGRASDPLLRDVKAFSEATERYAIYHARHLADVACAPRAHLRERAIDPEELAWFAPEQYRAPNLGCVPFTSDLPCAWTRFIDTADGKTELVPTGYFAYGCTPQLVHPATEGCASHFDRDRALLAGTLEIVEHDAIMTSLLAALHRPSLAEPTLPESARQKLAAFAARGWSTTILDLTAIWDVPCLLSLHRMRRSDNGVCEGGLVTAHAASLTAEACLDKLLDDAELYLALAPDWARAPLGTAPFDQRSQKRLFVQNRAAADAVVSALRPQGEHAYDTTTALADGAALFERVRRHGYRVLYADITPRDVRRLTPFIVTRALIAGAQPISWGPWKPHLLGSRRLRHVRERFGASGEIQDVLAPF